MKTALQFINLEITGDYNDESWTESSFSVDTAISAAIKYAEQAVDASAEQVRSFETLVDTYDCIHRRNDDVASAILSVKEELR